VSEEVREFFEAFERNSTAMDLDAIGAQFAEVFLSADPQAVRAVPKAAFLAALSQREKMFSAAGIGHLRLESVRETVLDSMHTLAGTSWIGERKDGGEITLESTFILRREGQSFVVVFYLNHQNLGEVLAPKSEGDPAVD
jgi:hypothetical protein